MELNCNPYDLINRLVMTCSVEGPNTPVFSISWLRRINNRDEVLQSTQQRVDIDITQTIPAQFTRRSSRLTLNALDETIDVGQYWCQVRLDNGTFFQEHSSNLTLRPADHYQLLSRCTGSSVINERSCLGVFQIMPVGPSVTDGDKVTGPSVDLTFSSSSDQNYPPTTQTTTDLNEEEEDNRFALYAVITVTVVALLIVLFLLIVISTIKYKQHQTTKQILNEYVIEDGGRPEQEVSHQSQTSPIATDGNFDFKENIAYNKVGMIVLSVNVSYVESIPKTPDIPQEYEVFVQTTSS